MIWLAVIFLVSFTVGAIIGRMYKGKAATFLAAVGPWSALLIVLVVTEPFFQDAEGGASMWPIAQLVGGTVAAASGLIGCKLVRDR